jgi:hypothetical protein
MPATVAIALPSVPLPWLLGGSLVGYLLVIYTNPVRASLRDGFRCLRRYSMLWLTLGAFGFAYALFQLALRFYFYNVLPPDDRPVLVWVREAWRDPNLWLKGSPESLWYLPPHSVRQAVLENVLPALESVAGIFNLLVTTFPLSAFAAFLFFVNWENHHTVLARSLRKRFGLWGWVLHAGIMLCALAALAKPLLYAAPLLLGLPPPAAAAWFHWAPVAEWLSFLFEYLAGVCVQLGLILVAYCWVRGLSFTHQHLIDFAIRRLSFVVRWALLVMVLSSLLIHLPLILKNFALFQSLFPPEEVVFDARWKVARAVLTGVLLIFSTMQITLTFHSESLGRAFRDHRRFMAKNWWPLCWFFVLAALHFHMLRVVVTVMQRGLGDGTALGIACGLLAPWLHGLMAAWLLASWVCFYKHADAARTPPPSGVLEQGVLF